MKSFRSVLALWAVCFVASSAHAAEARKPNIILIFADDYGLPGVGCYGGAYKTPHLDALAAGGQRYTHCYSMPLCGPSRATVLSGRYTFRNGVLTNQFGDAYKPTDSPSIAVALKSAGYATAVAGKWGQLSYMNGPEDARAWGFDEALVWNPGGDNEKGSRYWDPVYFRDGKQIDGAGKYGPDLLHDFTVDFIKRHRDDPFFIYYPTPLIHGPILHTPDSKNQTDEKKNKFAGDHYADNVAYLDKLVGKLTAELDALKLRENTLIVFTGDNGSTGAGPFTVDGKTVSGKKGTMLEGGSRVPLIVNWQGTTPAGKVVDDLVDFTDFYATFVDLAGGKLPEGTKFDSHSFAARVRGETGTPRSSVFVQLGAQWYARSKDWKLDQSGQLFSMKNAPFEQIEVAADANDPAAEKARGELKAALDELNPAGGKTGGRPGGKKVKKKKAKAAE